MPRSSRYRLSAAGEQLPVTLQRSCEQAQALFRTALAEAVAAYGDSDQAVRAAYAALKKEFEKRGDQWVARTEPAA